MHDLMVAFVFVGMILIPAVVTLKTDAELDEE